MPLPSKLLRDLYPINNTTLTDLAAQSAFVIPMELAISIIGPSVSEKPGESQRISY